MGTMFHLTENIERTNKKEKIYKFGESRIAEI